MCVSFLHSTAALKKLPHISTLQMDGETLEDTLRSFVAVTYEPGDVILHQGAYGDTFYVCEYGLCEVYTSDSTRPVAVLENSASQPYSFGEAALIDNQPRNATIRALTCTKLWILDQQT